MFRPATHSGRDRGLRLCLEEFPGPSRPRRGFKRIAQTGMGEGLMLLKGKIAIVTGIGPGLGREIALQFAQHGARLAPIPRRYITVG